jgi:hypothetical protein
MISLRSSIMRWGLTVLFTGLSLLLLGGCKPKEGTLYGNQPPIIRLAKGHIHPGDTLTSPRITLDWVGDDPDGYVVGYRYYFSNDNQKPRIILNIMEKGFALMAVTQDFKKIPEVYKYFATLPVTGLDDARVNTLKDGDSILVAGVWVFASNSDSTRVQSVVDFIVRETNPYPIHTNPNKGTFLLNSPDPFNHVLFDVCAIDNSGDTSANPGIIDVWTTQVTKPNVGIDQWPTSDTSFVVLKKTDVFTGLYFHFVGNDPNSRTIEYSWAVDKDAWLTTTDSIPWSDWSPIPNANISASDFPPSKVYDTKHTFWVRARSEFGVISSDSSFTQNGGSLIYAYRDFNTVYPTFRLPGYHQKILLINDSYGPPDAQPPYDGTPMHPDRFVVDDFYKSILTGLGKQDSDITVMHLTSFSNTFPTDLFAQSSLIIIYMDALSVEGKVPRNLRASQEDFLRAYCSVGGNLVMTGWGLNRAQNIALGTFWDAVIHVSQNRPSFLQGNGIDFIAAEPVFTGYPTLAVDTTKLDPAWGGVLYDPDNRSPIRVAYPVGFGESLYKYHGNAANSETENQSVAVRFLTYGVSEDYFNSYFFAFPLYYMQRPGVDNLLGQVIHEMGQ